MQPKKLESTEAETDNAIRNLIQRFSIAMREQPVFVIAFIAARAGEGTSTITRKYASMLASETGQKVLLVDAGVNMHELFHVHGVNPSVGMADILLAGKELDVAIHSLPSGVFITRWLVNEKNRAAATKIAHENDIWKTLSSSFDAIIIDSPSLQNTFDGVMLAAKADATVLIVEAEKTPEPVIRNLRDTLQATGAKIAGIVMNKRHHYIPEKLYHYL